MSFIHIENIGVQDCLYRIIYKNKLFFAKIIYNNDKNISLIIPLISIVLGK